MKGEAFEDLPGTSPRFHLSGEHLQHSLGISGGGGGGGGQLCGPGRVDSPLSASVWASILWGWPYGWGGGWEESRGARPRVVSSSETFLGGGRGLQEHTGWP